MIPVMYCSQCDREQRVSELDAFGFDKLRSTLSCGHVVPKFDNAVECL